MAFGDQLPAQYTVDGLTLGALDDDGNWWVPQTTKGWHGPPKMKSKRDTRPNGIGTFRAPAFRDERIISIQGCVMSPDVLGRLKAEARIQALCSDPGQLYEFRGVNQAGDDLLTWVELNDAPDVVVQNETWVDFSLSFAAPDPRKHHAQLQAPIAGPPVSTSAGLDFSTPGLNFASPGLDFGSPAIPQPVSVGNYGTAPAAPVIQIYGPAISPTVNCLTSGYQFTYAATLVDGETVSINCDIFEREGYPPRRAISNLHGDVRSLLNLNGWPSIDPGGLETFTLQATATPTTQLKVILRSAWW